MSWFSFYWCADAKKSHMQENPVEANLQILEWQIKRTELKNTKKTTDWLSFFNSRPDFISAFHLQPPAALLRSNRGKSHLWISSSSLLILSLHDRLWKAYLYPSLCLCLSFKQHFCVVTSFIMASRCPILLRNWGIVRVRYSAVVFGLSFWYLAPLLIVLACHPSIDGTIDFQSCSFIFIFSPLLIHLFSIVKSWAEVGSPPIEPFLTLCWRISCPSGETSTTIVVKFTF